MASSTRSSAGGSKKKKVSKRPFLQSGSPKIRRNLLAVCLVLFVAVGYLIVRYSFATGIDAGLVVRYNFENLTSTTIPNVAPIANASALDGRVHNGTAPLATYKSPNGTKALTLNHVENADGTTNYATSQEIDVPNGNGSPQSVLKVNDFTIASWVHITDTDTNEASWEIAEKDASYWMNIRNGNDSAADPANATNQTDAHRALRCGGEFGPASKYVEVTSAADLIKTGPNAPWYYVACTYDNSHLSIYINGHQVGTLAVTGTTATNDNNLTVGGNNKPEIWGAANSRHNFVGGDMDGFRLYNRALSVSEVQTLATLNVGSPTPTSGSQGISISGNRFLRNGQPFIPEGMISVAALDTHGYAAGCSNSDTAAAASNFGTAELTTIRTKWHANTLRLHVSQPVLAGSSGVAYAQHVASMISAIEQAGMVPIISMQNESWGCGPADAMPTAKTKTAWNALLSNTNLKQDTGAMFEIYNEPQVTDWSVWLNGSSTYVGHQQMTNYLRSLGVTGVIVVDGTHLAGHLDNVPTISDPGGHNQIAYAIHPLYYADGPSGWQTRWGNTAAVKPVIADAWNCGNGSAALSTEYFKFQEKLGVGTIGYAVDDFSISSFVRDRALDPSTCGQQFISEYTSSF